MNFLNTFTHYQIVLKFSLGKGASSPSYWVEISTNFLGNSRHAKNTLSVYLCGKGCPLFLLGCIHIDISQLYEGIYDLFGTVPFPITLWELLKVAVPIFNKFPPKNVTASSHHNDVLLI